ncbi:hypothetical protein I3760_08G138100 [Carya illinoinensis]|nr:hypothetical protein I3760_08G138100 [Carya illinoinensis]
MTFGLGRSPEQEGKGKEPRSLKKDSMMLSRCYCISLNTRGPVLHRLVVDLRKKGKPVDDLSDLSPTRFSCQSHFVFVSKVTEHHC